MEFIEAPAFTRYVYDQKVSDQEIWLLTIYGKSDTVDIPAHVLRSIAKEIEDA